MKRICKHYFILNIHKGYEGILVIIDGLENSQDFGYLIVYGVNILAPHFVSLPSPLATNLYHASILIRFSQYLLTEFIS